MQVKTLALMSAAALALVACGKKAEDTTPSDNAAAASAGVDANATADANSAAPVAVSGGQAFANTAAASDAFEIATSKLADTNGASAPVKKFATQMITAHTASTAKLKSTAAALSPAITPDPTLTADQQTALDGLKDKKGAEFDTAYAAAQVDGHQKTLDALKAYAATGDVPEFKTIASGLVPTVTAHLNMAKALK